VLGYGFAFGNVADSEFIGNRNFGGEKWLTERSENHGACASFFALCGFFVLFVINGGMSEKVKYHVYVVLAFMIMLFVWPVIVAWSWGGGWLAIELKKDLIDVGGAINIHMFAGAIGLMGAIFSGYRRGRWRPRKAARFTIQMYPIYIIGAVLLILGIFGLNFSIGQSRADQMGMSAANSWICAGATSIVALKLLTLFSKDLHTHTIAIYQGFIAGMVVISSSAYNTTPWQAGIVGIMTGVFFAFTYKFVLYLQIDDPMSVTATFLVPGLVGGILPGFITDEDGCFWQGISGHTLSTQVIGVIVVLGWALAWAVILFTILTVVGGMRLRDHIQKYGLKNTLILQSGFVYDDVITKGGEVEEIS